MTLRSSDLQADSDLDSIRNSCDVFIEIMKNVEADSKAAVPQNLTNQRLVKLGGGGGQVNFENTNRGRPNSVVV